MTAPRWTLGLLRRVAPPGRAEEVVGDLEETHRKRVQRRGRAVGTFLTGLEALDMALTLMRRRFCLRPARRPPERDSRTWRRRGINWLSPLDFKLGLRMLVKYPGLTVVGGLAMAAAIAVGTGSFVFITDAVHPTLPMEDGDRIVELRNTNVRTGVGQPATPYDLLTWREELQSVDDISAGKTFRGNLVTEDGHAEPVVGAEMTASAFRMTRAPALLGRTIVDEDERVGAPRVAVIGYDVWRRRLDGDPEVVGRIVRLGSEEYTVVGVMPEGFEFPSRHQLWTPLRLRVADYQPGRGPAIGVFGRLAPSVSIEEAQVGLSALGARASAGLPDTYEHLRPKIERYGALDLMVSGVTSLSLYSLNALFFLALLTLVSANVALLVFARTASREREIVVRTALGAGRGRIVMQLVAEALVLGAVAAVVGLVAADRGLDWAVATFDRVEGGDLPYWIHDGITPAAALYAGVFTVFGAMVVGVVPALKATGRKMHARLQRVAGHGSGLRMGGLWTGVIVTQVAVTVFFVRLVIQVGIYAAEIRSADMGFPAEEFLSGRLAMDAEGPGGSTADTSGAAFVARFDASYRELARRVSAEPGVTALGFAAQIPGAYHPRGWIEVAAPESSLVQRVQMGSVDPDFFDALGAPIVAGRGFSPADLDSDAGVVIVNESFVRDILGGRNAVGRRVRYLQADSTNESPLPDRPPGPWYEIVGVVRDVAMNVDPDMPRGGGIYHLLAPADEPPVRLAVHVTGDPVALAPRLRSLALAVDPALRLDEVRPMDEGQWSLLLAYDAWFRVAVVAGAIVLLLSNAGIYAIMSFAVSRRTREIGVRVALGADARRIVSAIFSRSLKQVTLGVALGALLLAAVGALRASPKAVGLFAAYVSLMTGVCLLACIVPTRRALRIQPTEALREE